MAVPKITDLVLYVNKALRGIDWNTNWQKIINWLTGGDADIKVNSVTTNSLENSGTITSDGLSVNGNADISGDLSVGGIISGDGRGLTNVQSTSTIAYTPFAVNDGYVDRVESSVDYGKEKLMKIKDGYTNIIEFDEFVNDNTPLTCTTSDGVTFTLNQLDDFDVSNQLDGTFVVCVKKNQQRVELKESVYRQRLAPTDNTIPNNTLWLNTSTENIQCYEKLNNVWTEKYDGVPIGEVKVVSGEIDTLKTYHYNWNGYNINVQETTDINYRPLVIIKSWYATNINWSSKQTQTDYYEIYNNGLVIQSGRVSWNSGGAGEKTLSLAIPLSKVCSVKITDSMLINNEDSSGSLKSVSGGTIKISAGSVGNSEGCVLWEVKGYK